MTEEREPYDPDWDAIGARIKDAVKRSRGYASWWEYAPVPRLGEHHAASVLKHFLFGEEAVDALVFPNQDPPDLILPLAGRRIGIEVTEIIDPKAVERARFLKKQRGGWDQKDLPLAGWPWADWSAMSRRRCSSWSPGPAQLSAERLGELHLRQRFGFAQLMQGQILGVHVDRHGMLTL